LTKTIHIKNAKMNEPYSEVIDVVGLNDFRLIDDGGSGLAFDNSSRTLNGTPSKSGDFVLRIQGFLGRLPCDLYANLAVIPDPRSLWITKPHDSTAPFAKEDEDSGVSRGDLLCVAASKRGRSHAREGLFRDDDFALWTGGPGGWNIAVVADGAGSAKYSRRGSQIAVRTIVRDLPSLLEAQLTGQIDGLVAEYLNAVAGAEDRIRTQLYLSLATAAFNAAKAIGDEAARAEEREGSFSTTLVLSVARKVPHGWFIAGFSIGDGGAAIFDLPSRTVKTLTLADSGEFAGQTRFLQKSEFAAGYEEVAKRLFFDVRDSFTAVLAMTDGITDPKFPTDTAFASSDVWSSFWDTDLSQSVLVSRENTALERELLAWLDFWSPGNHDDRTIAIMLP
jgi:serine/threonine protein phosphatase PrpC